MTTKLSDISHEKHSLDAREKTLGRLATQVATLLTGKAKPYFTRHLDCGDFVAVTNASLVRVTGNKEVKKTYSSFSGYPGGLKKTLMKNLRKSNPEKIIYNAISGMLPDNKLKKFWLARLNIES